MIEAAEAIQRFTARRRHGDLEADQMLLFALVRAIEIIGEAASKISVERRAAIADVPWLEIISMRNRLVHAYFDVNRDILWKTVTEEIPHLLSLLRAALPER